MSATWTDRTVEAVADVQAHLWALAPYLREMRTVKELQESVRRLVGVAGRAAAELDGREAGAAGDPVAVAALGLGVAPPVEEVPCGP